MAKKLPDRLRAGEARLSESGVGADAGVDQLAEAVGRDADIDLAIVHRLGAVATPASAELLRRIERDASKDLRKEIKRSLYRLEQRGVEVPAPARTEPKRAPVSAGIEGYVSAFDGRGDRLVWLVKPRPGSVLHLFAVVNDPRGLREVALNRLTRKGLREIQSELRSKHDIRFVTVDWRHADRALQLGLEWAHARGEAVDGDYPALRAQLTGEPPAPDLPPILDQARLVPSDQDLVDSAEILLEPEMRTWLLSEELAGKAVEELVEIRNSPLVLNDAQLTERFEAVNDRIVEQAFGGELLVSWQRRLEEMAYYFAKTSRPDRARQAAAAAQALRAGRSLSEIPFCAIYVRRTLGMYMAETEQRQEEERQSSLIVTPDQLRRKQRRS